MIWLWIYAAEALLIAFLAWVARGPKIPDEWCDCRECCDTMARLQVLILEVLDDCPCEDDVPVRLGQPVREACELDVREEVEWQRIVEGS